MQAKQHPKITPDSICIVIKVDAFYAVTAQPIAINETT
jgi:hypothetical protein